MARPQEQNVTQRRAVATIEDQNKYAMPDGRRLRVFADPLRMNVEAEVPNSVRLAEALAKVKPALMDAVVDHQSTINAQEVQQGILDRTKGLSPEEARSEWRQYGFQYQSAYLAGEDLGAKLEADVASKDPNVPFEQWYQEWWDTNGQDVPNDPEHNITFNKSFTKSLVKAKEFDTQNVLTLQKEQQMGVATESIFRSIKEIRANGLPVTTSDWDIIKKGLSKGFSNPETDALFYNAIERYAKENSDPDALNVLYEKRGEVPALIDNPKYTQKIVALRESVANDRYKKTLDVQTKQDKAVKAETDKFEQDIRFKIIELGNIEDPVTRSAKLTEVLKEVEVAKGKYILSSGFINTLESRITKADKGEATAYQEQSYRALYTSNASFSQIDRAVAEGDITQAQWQKLMDKKQQQLDRAAKASEKGEKPIDKNPLFIRADKELKDKAGYSTMDFTPDAPQRQTNYRKAKEHFQEQLDEYLNEGKDNKEAIALAKKDTDLFMDKMGITSRQWEELSAKETTLEGKAKAIQKHPYQYYKYNIKDFASDVKKGVIPPNLTPQEKSVLQALHLKTLKEEQMVKSRPKSKKVNN